MHRKCPNCQESFGSNYTFDDDQSMICGLCGSKVYDTKEAGHSKATPAYSTVNRHGFYGCHRPGYGVLNGAVCKPSSDVEDTPWM